MAAARVATTRGTNPAAAAATGIVRTTTIISTITVTAIGGTAIESTTFATGITETETTDPDPGTPTVIAGAEVAAVTTAEVAPKAFVKFEKISRYLVGGAPKTSLFGQGSVGNRRFVHCCESILVSRILLPAKSDCSLLRDAIHCVVHRRYLKRKQRAQERASFNVKERNAWFVQ